MKVDFFKKELDKVQDRFNQTFGIMPLCDLKLRQSVIFTICHMGCLAKEMAETKSRDHPHNKIARFMQGRNALNRIFDQLEKHLRQRREHNGHNGPAKETERGNICCNESVPHGAERFAARKKAVP